MKKRIRKLAEKAGFIFWQNEEWKPPNATIDWSCIYDEELEKFAKLVRADERKKCMKQEPVGEIVHAFCDLVSVSIPKMPPVGTKLYTAPLKCEPKREWVSLTSEEIVALIAFEGASLADIVKHIDFKLREKNI